MSAPVSSSITRAPSAVAAMREPAVNVAGGLALAEAALGPAARSGACAAPGDPHAASGQTMANSPRLLGMCPVTTLAQIGCEFLRPWRRRVRAAIEPR